MKSANMIILFVVNIIGQGGCMLCVWTLSFFPVQIQSSTLLHSPDDGIDESDISRTRLRYPSTNLDGSCERVTGPTYSGTHSVWRGQTKTIYTLGRPPWYDASGQIQEPFVMGICGGSGSGKTTVARKLIEYLSLQWVSLVSMDSFYAVLTPEEHIKVSKNQYNFDHPDAFDLELIRQCLERLRAGKSVQVPVYDFTTHTRQNVTKTIYGANVVIFEGIMVFESRFLPLLDLKIYVDTDADERLDRRLRRDINERKRNVSSVLDQYERYVKPAYETFVAPMMKYADVIIPRGGENRPALRMLVPHVIRLLEDRGCKLRCETMGSCLDGGLHSMLTGGVANLHTLPETDEIYALHTIIRNRATPRSEFIFYADRLMRLLFEYTYSLMSYVDHVVECDDGQGGTFAYKGRKMSLETICAVSILRAGETLEPAAASVFKDIRFGRILIQTNEATLDPELHYLRLPLVSHLQQSIVLVLDPTVSTGAAAKMAIRVLVDHDVPQRNIYIVSLLMASQGVQSVARAFPGVHIVTTAVDVQLSDNYYIVPGMGNFGDRYFGTEPDFSDCDE